MNVLFIESRKAVSLQSTWSKASFGCKTICKQLHGKSRQFIIRVIFICVNNSGDYYKKIITCNDANIANNLLYNLWTHFWTRISIVCWDAIDLLLKSVIREISSQVLNLFVSRYLLKNSTIYRVLSKCWDLTSKVQKQK